MASAKKNAARFAPFTIGLKRYRINTVVMHKAALQKLLTYMDRMGAIASGTGTGQSYRRNAGRRNQRQRNAIN